ncbi:MAG: competence protein ComA [Ruminiclostridium sp.]|nr:competence protein ComA [Ruminiclostridium sp.]
MLSIDITDKQIRLVRGALNGNKIRVLEVETRNLAAGCISNGYVTDIPMVAGEITDIIATNNIKDKEAIVCINSGSILYKDMTIPKPKKISNSAAIESMILTTMGITKEYNISYSIVGETKDENDQPAIKLLATACPQRMVDGYIRLFTQLGIKLHQINVSNNCITRLILNTPKLEGSMPLMLVQIDNDFINLNLYEDNQLTLSRYVRVDPYDYNNDEDYINQAVYDNLFRTLQFTSQRKDAKPLKEIMFYGQVTDFISLSNAVSNFNVPSHILNIPNNIVTFCDFDFAEYANAIGAFFKVRKDLDHVNLLDASAVKEKKGANMFFVGLGAAALVTAGAVLGAKFVCDGIAGGIKTEGEAIYAEIHSDANDQKQRLLEQKQTIYENILQYSSNIMEADRLFRFQPQGISEVRDILMETIQSVEEKATIVGDLNISQYSISIEVRCYDIESPTKIVRALIDADYFDDIQYTGFSGAKVEKEEEEGQGSRRQNSQAAGEEEEYIYSFPLTMQLRGGNGYEIK